MTISLPADNLKWSAFRVLVRRTFGAGAAGADQSLSGKDWQILPMQRKGQRVHGLEVVSFSRGALPYVGRAVLKLEYGIFADGMIGADSTSTAQVSAGAAWDPSGDATNVQDLRGYEVRIQAAPQTSDNSTPQWRTVWWGTCEYQEDEGAPGAKIPMGTRYFHCVDGLQRAARWMMNRHGWAPYYNGNHLGTMANCVGAVGYNISPDQADSRISKNCYNSSPYTTDAGVTIYPHCAPGDPAAIYWTARTAAEHALGVTKPPEEPLFAFRGYNNTSSILNLLGGTFAWPVRETDSALDILVRICDRKRGRGCVFVDWADDVGSPTGPLQVFLTVAPQLLSSLTYVSDFTTGATTTLPGATTAGTTATVDLIGDHRAVAGAFKLSDPYQNRFDYLEVVGEPIEVAATLSYKDGQTTISTSYIASASLAPRWTAAEVGTFRNATAAVRSQARYKHVYQAHGLPTNWSGLAGDGNGGTLNRIDYRCDDNGNIVIPSSTDSPTNPSLVKILSDVPLFNGYNYTTNAVTRWDTGSDQATPTRREHMIGVWISAGRFLRMDETSVRATLRMDNLGEMWVTNGDDQDTGNRALSDTGLSAVSPAYSYQNLWMTVGLRLPHRVRLAFGKATGRKRTRAEFKDFCLWLGAPGCIWDLDTTVGSASAGWAAKTAPAGGNAGAPGILRDDRAALSAIGAQMWAFLGTDTNRRTASWAVRDCGFLPSFTATDSGGNSTTITYPTLGQMITTMYANGQPNTLNTPVTLMEYNNQTGVTTWSTEWQELDLE